MPTVQVFVACAFALVDQGTEGVSLINLLDSVKLEGSGPPPAYWQTPWCVMAITRPGPGEPPGAMFEQKVEFVKPDQTIAFQAATEPFQYTKRGHRQAYNFTMFPVDQPGECNLRLSMRASGTPDWEVLAHYPIWVEIRLSDQPIASPPVGQ